MMKRRNVLFEDALELALEKAKLAANISKEITLVRDFRGRIRLLLPGNKEDYKEDKEKQLFALCKELSKALANYGFPPERMALFSDDLVQDISSALSRDRLLIRQEQNIPIFLLDRQIIGHDWLRESFTGEISNPRVAFFGIKGGVGRSTALIIWAWRLAKQGKKVLIFDLDLESPGVSSTILPKSSMPDFGIVDWFVEDGVGQAENVEDEMAAASPLAQGLPGEIRIVPAYGSKTNEYLPKLARCYSDSAGETSESWGARLERLVVGFEERLKPDIVILDSRAGIHDIAASAVTRMEALSLLFAVDSPQTWKAYEFLFHHWKQHPNLPKLRERLQIVASMIPETGREEYVNRFRTNAWDLFRNHLYEEAEPNMPDAFSFDIDDEDAPHYPLLVFWHRALQEFNPIGIREGINEKTANEALEEFVNRAFLFAFGEEYK
ncbi:MAG: AAA family ATPase [Candidatus Omnitrophota bacterium]